MGGVLNHPTPENLSAWMRDVERRMLTQERRSAVFSAEQMLGPGFGRFARQVVDWNEESTWLSGQFWSDIGSLHSPDSAIAWIGVTRSASGRGGVQELLSLDTALQRRQRTFTFTAGTPTFSAWDLPNLMPHVGRSVVGNVGGFGVNYADSSSGNIPWTKDYVAGTDYPVTARRALLKAGSHEYAAGNQQVTNSLQYRFNGAGAWTNADAATEHNNGINTSDLGSTLVGWVDLGTNAVLNLRGQVDVAGGGFSVGMRMTNLSVNFFS